MNVIKRSGVDSSLHFTLGKKLGMSANTATCICFDFIIKRETGSKTIAINTPYPIFLNMDPIHFLHQI